MKLERFRVLVLPYLWSLASKHWVGRFLGASILMLTTLPTTSVAQNGSWDSIRINGTYIQLGMTQSEVLARLAESSTLKKDNIANHWCVQPKGFVGYRGIAPLLDLSMKSCTRQPSNWKRPPIL